MKIPTHIAFIMDGNRRWAKSHKLEILFGHDKGAKLIEPLTEYAQSKGVKHVTFWAFSTENWNRSEKELEMLMTVFRELVNGPMVKRMMAKNVRINTIGDISKFPKDIYESLLRLRKDSEKNTGIQAIFGLNYGGRAEILKAVNELLQKKIKKVDEKTFSDHLFTAGTPDPDMIIRTGGEMRLSGFLPWQSAYAEYYFTQTLWPDFDEKELEKALKDYEARERRFGK